MHVTSELFWTYLDAGDWIHYITWKWVEWIEQLETALMGLEHLVAEFGLGPSLMGIYSVSTLQTIWRCDNESTEGVPMLYLRTFFAFWKELMWF